MKTALLLYLSLLNQDVLVVPQTGNPHVPLAYIEHCEVADEAAAGRIQRELIETLTERGITVTSVLPVTRGPGGDWVPLIDLLPPIEPPKKRPWEHNALKGAAGSPVLRSPTSPGEVSGALTGKAVYVSQSHGWYWSTVLNRWAAQRGNNHDIVEDFVNAEGINHYFIPLLQRAGAVVFPVREPDRNPDMVVVDDDEAVLEGDWSLGGAGWGPHDNLLVNGQSPFEEGATRYTTAAESATASATFLGAVPVDGTYGVNLSWRANTDRAPDVRVEVHHAGGVAHFQVDQRRHGGTWVYLGRFRFRQGQAKVVFTNQSAFPGKLVTIDAVRFGGGVGMVQRGDGAYPAKGPTTGRARWESCSRYHAQVCGAPKTVYDSGGEDNSDDVSARSRYAAWQHEDGEDAVFVSWHSNAPSPARGTSTWVYGPDGPGSPYQFTGIAGSDKLAQTVHDEIIKAIKAEWDPNWKDRGIKSAWFGELNPKHNPEMPSTLVEVAFHSTEEDAAYLAEPRFRYTLARAYYRGIVRYFAERDGFEPLYLPEPPTQTYVVGQDNGGVSVSWTPSDEGHPADTVRVWTSTDGFAFDSVASAPAADGALILDAPGSIGAPLYVYLTATNAGGESFPSPTLAVMPSCNPAAERALVVQGFTRLDRFSLPRVDLEPWDLGHPMRLDQDQVNTFDYSIEHAVALANAGVPFDGAEASAVEAETLALDEYGLVDWILGEESTDDETFSEAEQAVVSAYLDAGGRLIATGAELLWDLDEKGSAADKAFAAEYLKATLASDDAETYQLEGGIAFTNGFDVAFPDVLAPTDGASVLWNYASGQPAGIAWSGAFGVVTAGFPLEAVEPDSARTQLIEEAIGALGWSAVIDHCEAPIAPDPGLDNDAGSGGTTGPGEDVGVIDPPDDDLNSGPSDIGVAEPAPRGDKPALLNVQGKRNLTNEGCSQGGDGPSKRPTALWLVALGVCALRLRRKRKFGVAG